VEDPVPYTAEQFQQLALLYPDLRMERTRDGEIVILPPAFSDAGRQNSRITGELGQWVDLTKTGECFDSSAGFTLPNSAVRSPDTSWIEKSRWEALTRDQRTKEFALICPDFVVELRSTTDRLSVVQAKMREYRENGARLGWLIDPPSRRVEIYRPEHEVEVLPNPETISGDPELPGFVLELTPIWGQESESDVPRVQ
jgi:Uma2 family endonuclease